MLRTVLNTLRRRSESLSNAISFSKAGEHVPIAHMTTSHPLSQLPGSVGSQNLVPVELKLLKAAKRLEVKFTDGSHFSLPAEYLRVKSPSADTHMDPHGRPKVVSGRRHVGIMKIEPVGSYAVRIYFDDLHQAGIYTWDFLHDLGIHKLCYMKEYLRQLRAMGLSRDPKRPRQRTPTG